MKRVIKASKYSRRADKTEKWIGTYASILADVVNATNEEELHSALAGAGSWFERVNSKKEAIKGLVDQLNDVCSEYLINSNANDNVDSVRDSIIDMLESKGYYLQKASIPKKGSDESYVALQADIVEHEDLIDLASIISKEFGIKPNGMRIGGSWTSYPFELNGVRFDVGFEPDYDYDPSGKEYSLQISF